MAGFDHLLADGAFRRLLAKNPGSPRGTLVRLLAQYPDMAWPCTGSVLWPPTVLRDLYESPVAAIDSGGRNGRMRPRLLAIAGHAATPHDVLASLSLSDACAVRGTTAANRATLRRELARLAENSHRLVARTAIANRSAPEGVLRSAAQSDDNRCRRQAAANKTTRKDALEVLVDDPSRGVRMCVLRNPAAPVGVLSSATGDADLSAVRAVAARCGAAQVLYDMVSDRDTTVIAVMSTNTAAPGVALRRIAAERPVARPLLAANPAAPPDVLRSVASGGGALRTLAANSSTPCDLLASLAGHPEIDVRRGVACNRATPPAVLHAISCENSPEQNEVASNSGASLSTLLALADTGDMELVRHLVGNVTVAVSLASTHSLVVP